MRKRKISFSKAVVNALPDFFTPYRAAKHFGISHVTVHHWIFKRGMPTNPQPGGKYIIERDALVEWMTRTGRMK